MSLHEELLRLNREPMTPTSPRYVEHQLTDFADIFDLDPLLRQTYCIPAAEAYITGHDRIDEHFRSSYDRSRLASVQFLKHVYPQAFGLGMQESWYDPGIEDSERFNNASADATIRSRTGMQHNLTLGLLHAINMTDYSHMLNRKPNFQRVVKFYDDPNRDIKKVIEETQRETQILVDRASLAPSLEVTKDRLDSRLEIFTAVAQVEMIVYIAADLSMARAGSPEMRTTGAMLASTFLPDLFADDLDKKLDMLGTLSAALESFGSRLNSPRSRKLVLDISTSEKVLSSEVVGELYFFRELYMQLGFDLPLLLRSLTDTGIVGNVLLSTTVEAGNVPDLNLPEDTTLSEQRRQEHATAIEALSNDAKSLNGQWQLKKKDRSNLGTEPLSLALRNRELPILGKSIVSDEDVQLMHDVLVVLDRKLQQSGGDVAAVRDSIVQTVFSQQKLNARYADLQRLAAEHGYPVVRPLKVAPIEELTRWMCKEQDQICALLWRTWIGRKDRFQQLFKSLGRIWPEPDEGLTPEGESLS